METTDRSTPLRLSVLGGSGISLRRIFPAIAGNKNFRISFVQSRDPAQTKNVLSPLHDGIRTTNSLEEILSDPETDAVYISTPVHLHFEQALQSLRAGQHVFLEKPLCLTARQAETLCETASEAGLVLHENYMMRFHGAHEVIHRCLQQKKLGEVVSARLQLGCWYPRIEGAWRQNPSLSGGALMDLGSHLIDLAQWFFGAFKTVKCVCANRLFDYAVEDTAVLVGITDSNAVITLEASFALPDHLARNVIEINGTQGRILAENTLGQDGHGFLGGLFGGPQDAYDSSQARAALSEPAPIEYPVRNLYLAALDNFRLAIQNPSSGKINDGANGVSVVRIIENAYRENDRIYPWMIAESA